MMRDIHVDYYANHNREVSIYDRMGGGSIELSKGEAQYVKEELDNILD